MLALEGVGKSEYALLFFIVLLFMKYPIELKSTYDFVFRAPAILGASIRAGVVMATMDYDTAKNSADLISIHNAVYSYLETGTPKNVAELEFIKVKTISGEVRIFAEDWLAQEPIRVIARKIKLEINDVSSTDVVTLKGILNQNGFHDFQLSFLD